MCFILFFIRGYQMAGVMRVLTGIGLFTLGFKQWADRPRFSKNVWTKKGGKRQVNINSNR